MDQIRSIVDRQRDNHRDFRAHVFEVDPVSLGENRFFFQGRVLEPGDLDDLQQALRSGGPENEYDLSGVKVLRQPENRQLRAITNLTSLHRETSFMAELLSGMVYDWHMELLDVKDQWGFVRLSDGYLGWTYLPYLSEEPGPEPTHMAVAPVSRIRAVPEENAHPIGRVFGGTRVHLHDIQGEWAQVTASRKGWIRVRDLRALDAMPTGPEAIRRQMIADAVEYTGTPYWWGGITSGGIDCSGLAQLVHRLVGITIRRDADQQMWSGKPVEYPFQPGDLVFFGEQGDSRAITHVAVSLGGWEIIHSSRSRNGVYVDNIEAVESLRDRFAGGVSYIEG